MTETIPPDVSPDVRRLTRSRDGRWFGGVCAGLGRYFDMSPAIYRIVFAALALAGGTGILLYLAAWIVIPDDGAEASVAERALRDHRDRPGFLIGVGLLGFAAIVLLAHAAFWPHPGNLWLAALVVGAGLIWWEVRGGRPAAPATPIVPGEAADTAETAVFAAPPRPRKQSLFLPVVGVLLAGAGVIGLLEALDWASVNLVVALAASILFVGAAIVLGAATGRGVAGLVGLGILLLLALVPALVLHVPLRGGVGDRTYYPAASSEVRSHYRLAVGNLNVDLTGVRLSPGTTKVNVSVGVGNLKVHVPADVAVVARGTAGAGNVRLFGHEDNGMHVDKTVREPGSGDGRLLVLRAEVGAGNIQVDRG